MTPTFKIFLRTDFVKKDGSNPICLRYTLNRRPKTISLGVYCHEKHWLNNKNRIGKGDPDQFSKNMIIEAFENRAKQIIFDHRIEGKLLAFDDFKRHILNDHYGSKSFFSFVEDRAEALKEKFAAGTIKNYNDQLNKLKEFRKELSFSEIDNEFMLSYETFLKKTRKNNKNTTIKSLTFIKSMVNKAVEAGIIKESLCKHYKLGRIAGDREFLNSAELETLEKIYHQGTLKENKANVLRYFLFCCYTGLRYQDVKNLKFKHINEDILSIQMHKLKNKRQERVRIALIEKAIKILPEQAGKLQEQKVFNVLTDQPTNRYLKDIMQVAKINKNISFHCSRHTFATNALSLGIPLEVIKELLGHDDIKTTLIYAKLEDSVRRKEMEKWK